MTLFFSVLLAFKSIIITVSSHIVLDFQNYFIIKSFSVFFGQSNGHISITGDVYQDRLNRLEVIKNPLCSGNFVFTYMYRTIKRLESARFFYVLKDVSCAHPRLNLCGHKNSNIVKYYTIKIIDSFFRIF